MFIYIYIYVFIQTYITFMSDYAPFSNDHHPQLPSVLLSMTGQRVGSYDNHAIWMILPCHIWGTITS